MADDVLLEKLLEMFDSREEAEHVADCDSCSIFGDIEPGPYRCPENPVEVAEREQSARQQEAAQMVWALIDFARGISEQRASAIKMARQLQVISDQLRDHYVTALQQQVAVDLTFMRYTG